MELKEKFDKLPTADDIITDDSTPKRSYVVGRTYRQIQRTSTKRYHHNR